MNISELYFNKLVQLQMKYPKQMYSKFSSAAANIAALVGNPSAKYLKGFKFSTAPPLAKQIGDIQLALNRDLLDVTKAGISEAWNLSIAKNDLIFKGMSVMQEEAIEARREAALAAFIGRGQGTDTLSARVWQIAEQARVEMELHLAYGIHNGLSAGEISRNIRQYLINPDALFRRVRDKKTGKLVPSKAMAAYRPGRGVYKSAYKNAVRVARTETNMAYQMADHLRWMDMDMVIGIRIALSGSHPEYKFLEICEELAGDYPKSFVFTGWHPQCLCHVTPIMTPEDSLRKFLRGETSKMKPHQIKELPSNFVNYVQNQSDKLGNMENPPYWLKNNARQIEETLKKQGWSPKEVITKAAAETPPMASTITAWRNFKNTGQSMRSSSGRKGTLHY